MQRELPEQNHQGRKECDTLKGLYTQCCDWEHRELSGK